MGEAHPGAIPKGSQEGEQGRHFNWNSVVTYMFDQQMKKAMLLMEEMIRQNYRRGDTIPPIKEMANGFNCSRSDCENAAKNLAKRGILEQKSNGVYVVNRIPK